VYHGCYKSNHSSDWWNFISRIRQRVWSRTLLWVVDATLPEVLEATSYDENGQVMSLRHKTYDVRGTVPSWKCVLTLEKNVRKLGKQLNTKHTTLDRMTLKFNFNFRFISTKWKIY
jgi:hypothetical protein